ncbi:MAG: aldehyde dehydrogenase family protein [Mycobacteriales bacterium]
MVQASATAEDTAAVRDLAGRAAVAAGVLRRTSDDAIDAALRAAADLLTARGQILLEANEADLSAASAAGLSQSLRDRLRLDPPRLHAMADQIRTLIDAYAPIPDRLVRVLGDGRRVTERRVPVGVIGAIFEARPNVVVDVATQVLRARSAAVLRTGAAALTSSTALVDHVLLPALTGAGLPADAVQLVRSPGHGAADAILMQPDLIPLVVVRGSGPVTRHLAGVGASAGVQVLAHADGGGVLYVDRGADVAKARQIVLDSLDRLGVCNRLNLLLLDSGLPAAAVDGLLSALSEAGVAASMAPHVHPLGQEWALKGGAEATVTVGTVDSPEQAARIADHETSGLAAAVCAEDEAVFRRFLDNYGGTAALWNSSTRLVDGYRLLGLAETGINVDRSLGPRGPVTYLDLAMRQYVVLPPATG